MSTTAPGVHALAGPAGTAAIPVLLVALGLLAVAVAWRLVRALRVRRGVRAGLLSDDADVRVAAVTQAAELGLATTAPALLRAVRNESDPDVLAAVVRCVAARQWEPASTSKLVELRLWAKAYADRHPEVRRTVEAAPMLPGVAGAVPPPSLDARRADEFRTRSDELVPVPAARTATFSEPAFIAADDDPLSQVRVLVTGAGGPAGVAVISALRSRGHHVIAVDADDWAVGLRLADEHFVVPRADDPTYLAALLRAATVSDAQALICTVAEEYRALAGATEYLSEAGLRSLLPSAESAELCLDKWAFAQRLVEEDLPTPATNLGSADRVPGPWVVKPRFGRGSRDVRTVQTRQQLAAALRDIDEPLVQTQLTGREFTCDALVDADGSLAGWVARWRQETRGGISVRGLTFDDAEVGNVVEQVLAAVGLVGPANVQGFVHEDGGVTVHEVNPRFSGGLPLSLHAGADLVEEYLRAVLGLKMRPERLVARPGVTMMRHYSEVFAG